MRTPPDPNEAQDDALTQETQELFDSTAIEPAPGQLNRLARAAAAVPIRRRSRWGQWRSRPALLAAAAAAAAAAALWLSRDAPEQLTTLVTSLPRPASVVRGWNAGDPGAADAVLDGEGLDELAALEATLDDDAPPSLVEADPLGAFDGAMADWHPDSTLDVLHLPTAEVAPEEWNALCDELLEDPT